MNIVVVEHGDRSWERWAFLSEEVALDELRDEWVYDAESVDHPTDALVEAPNLESLAKAQSAVIGKRVEVRRVDTVGLSDCAGLGEEVLLALADWLTNGGVLFRDANELSWWEDAASFAENWEGRDARHDTERSLLSIGAPHAAIYRALHRFGLQDWA